MKTVIIIPILNPEEEFFTKIIPLLTQQTLKSEIILINSGEKIEESNSYKTIQIEKKDFNHANTRNLALEYEADFYLFMTQDATPSDEYLVENLINSFQKSNDIVVSYARQIPHSNAHITEKFARETNYPENSLVKSKEDISKLGIKTYFTSDSCAMYRGEYFRKQQGFKKDLNTSEDMEFAARAIWDDKKVFYCAEAKVLHSHIYTMKSLYKRYIAIGKFFKQNPWIEESIKNYISTEKTGFKQVLNEYKYILQKQPLAIFRAVLFTIVKLAGYKVGKK